MKRLPESPAYTCLEPREQPDAKKLFQQLTEDVKGLGSYVTSMMEDNNTLNCLWDGQSADGRKHKDDLGKDPDTWEGGSDARVRLAKLAANETVRVQMAALKAARLTVTPLNPAKAEDAALVTPVMHYVVGTLMRAEMARQPRLWAWWSEAHAISFLHVGWEIIRDTAERQLSFDQLLQWAVNLQKQAMTQTPAEEAPEQAYVMEAAEPPASELYHPPSAIPHPQSEPSSLQLSNPPALPSDNPPSAIPNPQLDALLTARTDQALVEAILDPARRDQLLDLIRQYEPEIADDEARRLADALKDSVTDNSSATYYVPIVKESRPTARMYQAGIDLILPAMTEDVQQTPRMARLRWLTAAQVADRAAQKNWPAGALEAVLARPGRSFPAEIYSQHSWLLSGTPVGAGMTQKHAEDSGFYQVIELDHVCMTKAGTPCTYSTVLHHAWPDEALEHRLQPEYHGRMPYVPLSREACYHQLLAGASLPAEALSWQVALKGLEDGIADNTDLRTRPPYGAPVSRFSDKKKLPVAPFCQIPTAGGKNFEWLPMPADSFQAERREDALFARAARFFGLAHKDVPDSVTRLAQQDKADIFLMAMGEVLQLIFQCCQQYLDPIVEAQVAGMPVPLNATKEQIQMRCSFSLSFDINDLDPEALMTKLKMLAEMALPFDSEGRIDRGELVEYIFSSIMPQMAPRLLKSSQRAAQDTVEREKTALGQIMAGITPAPPVGGNAAVALKAFRQLIQANPAASQIMTASPAKLPPQQAKIYQDILTRLKLIEFPLVQDKNRIIGANGADPGDGLDIPEAA